MEEIALTADPSLALEASFVLLSLVMAAGFAIWTGHRGLAASWMLVTGGLTAVGALQTFAVPPRLMIVFTVGLVGLTGLAWRSDWHRRPLPLLVGFQAFRILVELAIHRAVVEGVAPPQLTWSGRNWDVVTGVGALVLMPIASSLPRWLLHVWNGIGFALLVNVLSVAVLSMPLPWQVFEPDNVWVVFFSLQLAPARAGPAGLGRSRPALPAAARRRGFRGASPRVVGGAVAPARSRRDRPALSGVPRRADRYSPRGETLRSPSAPGPIRRAPCGRARDRRPDPLPPRDA